MGLFFSHCKKSRDRKLLALAQLLSKAIRIFLFSALSPWPVAYVLLFRVLRGQYGAVTLDIMSMCKMRRKERKTGPNKSSLFYQEKNSQETSVPDVHFLGRNHVTAISSCKEGWAHCCSTPNGDFVRKREAETGSWVCS